MGNFGTDHPYQNFPLALRSAEASEFAAKQVPDLHTRLPCLRSRINPEYHHGRESHGEVDVVTLANADALDDGLAPDAAKERKACGDCRIVELFLGAVGVLLAGSVGGFGDDIQAGGRRLREDKVVGLVLDHTHDAANMPGVMQPGATQRHGLTGDCAEPSATAADRSSTRWSYSSPT